MAALFFLTQRPSTWLQYNSSAGWWWLREEGPVGGGWGASGQNERVLQGAEDGAGLAKCCSWGECDLACFRGIGPHRSPPCAVPGPPILPSALSSLFACFLCFCPQTAGSPGGWGLGLSPGAGGQACVLVGEERRGPRLQCGSLRLAAGPDQRARGWASASTWGGLR